MSPSSESRAQKRAALGLAPHRPTAKSNVVRPPDPGQSRGYLALLPLGLVLIIAFTVFLMLGADHRLSSIALPNENVWQDWSWARLNPPDSPLSVQPAPRADAGLRQNIQPAPPPGDFLPQSVRDGLARPRLLLSDHFAQPDSIFADSLVEGKWRAEHVPEQAIYRFSVWPNHAAWSLLALDGVTGASTGSDGGLRVQTAVAIPAHAPWSYAGLATRVDDGRQLVLFVVDGQGRYSVQYLREGVQEIAVPWTAVDALNPAGTGNVLMLEDDGDTLRLFGNQVPLFQMRVAGWPQGLLGIAAGARGDGMGEARFEWFQNFEYTDE